MWVYLNIYECYVGKKILGASLILRQPNQNFNTKGFGEFIDKTHRNEYYELIKSPQIETLKGDEKENLKNCENTSSSNDKT